MNENSRCSILFHLLVAGGYGQPVWPPPGSSASSCRCSFQVRDRLLLLPPASAQIRIRLAPCFLWRPASFNHRRMLSTANSPVSEGISLPVDVAELLVPAPVLRAFPGSSDSTASNTPSSADIVLPFCRSPGGLVGSTLPPSLR